jgi:hypothetical protein
MALIQEIQVKVIPVHKSIIITSHKYVHGVDVKGPGQFQVHRWATIFWQYAQHKLHKENPPADLHESISGEIQIISNRFKSLTRVAIYRFDSPIRC